MAYISRKFTKIKSGECLEGGQIVDFGDLVVTFIRKDVHRSKYQSFVSVSKLSIAVIWLYPMLRNTKEVSFSTFWILPMLFLSEWSQRYVDLMF